MAEQESVTPPNESATALPVLDGAVIDAIIGGSHGAPHDVMGPHTEVINGKEALVIRAFRPLDVKVDVLEIKTGKRTPMNRIHPAGLFEVVFPRRKSSFP
jgi:hypothetical protein